MRFHPTPILIFLTAMFAAVGECQAEEPVRLMPLVVEWQYPGSKLNDASMEDAATMNRSGVRVVPSILCKAVLTTQDSVGKVMKYYETKLKPRGKPESAELEGESRAESGRSVMFHDDSKGRSLDVRIIIVNTSNTSTTLVVSRGDTESETHIAWTHYMRF
jgi:hypothetical protein